MKYIFNSIFLFFLFYLNTSCISRKNINFDKVAVTDDAISLAAPVIKENECGSPLVFFVIVSSVMGSCLLISIISKLKNPRKG
jgi:hypothetical protein